MKFRAYLMCSVYLPSPTVVWGLAGIGNAYFRPAAQPQRSVCNSFPLWSSSVPAGLKMAPSVEANQFESSAAVSGSAEWELDCYSRPVVVDGKKLWEVLITDSVGGLRICRSLPSNR